MMPVWAGCALTMLMCSRRMPTKRAIHRVATSQLTTMIWRINALFISSSVCFLLQSVLQFFQRQGFIVFTWVNFFYARCELRCQLCVTVAVPLEDGLGVKFAPLHPRQQGHPGEDLRHREGQAEAVGEIVITTRSAF
jgi:hypothetical protein